jgi:hypothetical protein
MGLKLFFALLKFKPEARKICFFYFNQGASLLAQEVFYGR